MNDSLFAFFLASLAGLATGIGSFLALFIKKEHEKLLSFLLAFASGVMLFGALTEIFQKGVAALSQTHPEAEAYLYALIAFFGGLIFLWLLQAILPESTAEKRSAILIGVSLALHNFPEGLATFTSALSSPQIAYPMVLAIALHNIPEGIAVAVPLLRAGDSRKKAFFLSFASGLAEPLGAAFGAFVLLPGFGDTIFGVLFAAVSGMMVFLSAFELLPDALLKSRFAALAGTIGGMATMALSLWLFRL